MQKVTPTSKIKPQASAHAQKVGTATELQQAVDFVGNKHADLASLKAQIAAINSELKNCKETAVIEAACEELDADSKVTFDGIDYQLDVSAKKNVSKVLAKELTAALLEEENHELLIQLASYTQTDMKKYVDNWDAFVESQQTGSRTLKYRTM